MSDQLRSILAQTLEDQKLTGSEKRALQEVIADSVLDPNHRALGRHLAFDLAKDELGDPKARAVLDWLEAVVKLLLPPDEEATIAESYFHPGDECTKRIESFLRNARRSADLCIFTITDNAVARLIIDAHQRGVAVRIITDNDKANDLGSDIAEFADAGVPVRVDRTDAHMHHKFALFDGRHLATGSYNWTRGAKSNMENLLVTDDPRFYKAFETEFENLWKQLS